MILRAKIILPVTAPPIENGAVVISKNKIIAVDAWKKFSHHSSLITHHSVFDLGEVILLPGLVNAHCHLDYTDMAGLLPPPKKFTDWIAAILATKSSWDYSDYAHSWLHGAKQLLQTGTTTVADIEAVPELLPEVWEATPLRVFSFLEMTGIRAKLEPQKILADALEKIESLQRLNASTLQRATASLSPHAPYSTLPELFQLIAKTARKKNWLVTTHIAESEPEFEMFAHARGAMFDWLKRNGRDNSDCGLGSPVAHFARQKLLGENVLAAHVNCLAPDDENLLAKNKTSVVHCPRSHDYFQHPKFERARLAKAGVNICLGTDSLATIRKTGKQKPELNLFAEMRALADADKTISPTEILRMATVNGARALNRAGKIGELSENAFADLIAIPFTGKNSEIYENVLKNPGKISASMISGEWTIPPTN